MLGLLMGAAYFIHNSDTKPLASASKAETYRLVHTVGNDEHVSLKGLSETECDKRKSELKTAATALGTYNESIGYGSIACLPESLFN